MYNFWSSDRAIGSPRRTSELTLFRLQYRLDSPRTQRNKARSSTTLLCGSANTGTHHSSNFPSPTTGPPCFWKPTTKHLKTQGSRKRKGSPKFPPFPTLPPTLQLQQALPLISHHSHLTTKPPIISYKPLTLALMELRRRMTNLKMSQQVVTLSSAHISLFCLPVILYSEFEYYLLHLVRSVNN